MIKRGNNIPVISTFDLNETPKNKIRNYWLKLISDGLGNPIYVPIMVARGAEDGPVLGVTAAIHGNELNGIPVIQRLFAEIETQSLKGTIIGVPVVNIPAYLRKKRRYIDGVDLNHIMPGKFDGNGSEVYAYRFFEKIVKKFEYLLDLHTASSGRVNSYYVRADMDDLITRKLALLQNAEIIVHNPPSDGTLRGAAEELKIPAITLELGNPNTFQKRLIRSGIEGIHNVLSHLEMTPDAIVEPAEPTIICKKSYWIYTDQGGLLTVTVGLKDKVKKGERIAMMRDVFGNLIQEYTAPEDGVVIGKSVGPVNQSGGRILHLGIEQ
jgi:predicted deacylase